MSDISGALLDSVHSAGACLIDIRELAGKLVHLSAGHVEALLLRFVDDGDDQAVSRLLQACAFNGVKLDPEVLCRCIGVCEEMLDSALCFALQDESAIQPLLAATVAEELSSERQIYAARLAAELTIKFDLDPQPVRKLLWKQEHSPLPPHYKILIEQSLRLLEQTSSTRQTTIPYWTELQPPDLLPEHRPRSIVGGDYTVRRRIAKINALIEQQSTARPHVLNHVKNRSEVIVFLVLSIVDFEGFWGLKQGTAKTDCRLEAEPD